jgi:hypothetical protein
MFTTITATTITTTTVAALAYGALFGMAAYVILIILVIVKELLSSCDFDDNIKAKIMEKSATIHILPLLTTFAMIVLIKVLEIL